LTVKEEFKCRNRLDLILHRHITSFLSIDHSKNNAFIAVLISFGFKDRFELQTWPAECTPKINDNSSILTEDSVKMLVIFDVNHAA